MKRNEMIEKIAEAINRDIGEGMSVSLTAAEAALKACEDMEMKPPYRKENGPIGAGYAWEPEDETL